jgi:hypothetical protein
MRRTKFNIVVPYLIWFSMLNIYSCTPSRRDNDRDTKAFASNEVSLPKYEIESKDFSKPLSKASIDIRLEKQTNEEQIRAIAHRIKQTFPGYDKYFIFYWLPEMELGTGAWATSHFTPNLIVNIIGASAEEESKMKGTDLMPEGEIIGKWYDGRAGVEKTIVIYKVGKQFKYRDIYPDGSFGDENLKKSGSKYTYANGFGEHFKIEDDGSLGWYSANGRFATAQKVN